VNEARTVERLAVESSAFKSIGYSEDRQILAIEFHSGIIRHYQAVPLAVFEAFAAAESRGQFFAYSIKGHFHSNEMTGLCPKCGELGLVGELCQCEESLVMAVDRHHKP
jgi:hypothetical protein